MIRAPAALKQETQLCELQKICLLDAVTCQWQVTYFLNEGLSFFFEIIRVIRLFATFALKTSGLGENHNQITIQLDEHIISS